MAVGFSGSNGGISKNKFANWDIGKVLDICYFVNNDCNLNCKHCYVGYNNRENSFSIIEWKKTFEDLIKLGAKTFGNVGKEPLLSWEKTKELLNFLKKKRDKNSEIRFGLVSNLTLMTEQIAEELNQIMPNYLDVSLDGTEEFHDFVRGKKNFEKTFNNLKMISENFPELKDKIFISFVLMKHNQKDFVQMLNELSKIGIKKILLSPYVRTKNEKETFVNELHKTEEDVIDFYKEIMKGNLLKRLSNFEIIIKNDRDTLNNLMQKCIEEDLINLNKLLMDEYGVIFNEYKVNSNRIIINYIPDVQFDIPIRISHDGYVGNCYAQFFEDYTQRKEILGNVKEKSIKEILKSII